MEACKNCQTNFEGNYCPNCGQRKNEGRIYFEDVKNDFFTYFIDFSSPLNSTVRGLYTKPGKFIKRFIEGERKRYYQPVQYFVISVAFYYFMRWAAGYDPVEIGYQLSGNSMPAYEDMNLQEKTSAFMSKHVNLLLFLLIAISSVFFRLVFRKSGYNYTEYLVFGFYSVAQFIQFGVLTIFLTNFSPNFLYINYAFVTLFPAIAMYGFQEKGKLWKAISTFFIMIFSFFLYVLIGFFISYFIVSLRQ